MAAEGASTRLWRVADAVMALVFLFSAVVQVNDPDPVRWIAIYGLATVASVSSWLGRVRSWLPALVALLALAWAVSIAPRVVGRVPFGDMFGAFEMRDTGVEESREMYGLLLVAGWMAVVAMRAPKRSAQRP